MKKLNKFIVFFLCVTLSMGAQEKVMLTMFDTYNLKNDYKVSATKLFKSYLESSQKYEVKLSEQLDSSVIEKDLKRIAEKAQRLNCTKFILGDLNRLGETVMITVNVYSTETLKKEWTGTDKALSPDDFDPIFQRIAERYVNGGVYEENIYTVTNYDSKQLNKKQTSYLYGVLLGGGPGLVSKMDNPYPAGFGMVFSYDSRKFIFDLMGELYFSDLKYQLITINVLKPFNDKDVTPYLNGALSFGGFQANQTEINNDVNKAGLFVQLGGGVLLSRTSDVNLRIGGKVVLPALQVKNIYPASIMLSVILNFKGI